MQPSAFDRAIPKGAAGFGGFSKPTSASQIMANSTKKSGNNHNNNNNTSLVAHSLGGFQTQKSRVEDSDEATDSDEDVLRMTDQAVNNTRRRRGSSIVQVTSAGTFSSPDSSPNRNHQQNRNNNNNNNNLTSTENINGVSTARPLSDKFFDPKLVRIRAENQRKKSQKSTDGNGATMSEEAQALGPATYKTADKSARLNNGELQCSLEFAPCISCIDESPADILRPQVPPACEHSTMVSFASENLLVVFGGLCMNQNDAKARATVDTSGLAKKKSKAAKKNPGSSDEFQDDDEDEDENDANPGVTETPIAGVASNTTWIYHTKNLIWTCISEMDLLGGTSNDGSHAHKSGGAQMAGSISAAQAAKINASIFDSRHGNNNNNNNNNKNKNHIGVEDDEDGGTHHHDDATSSKKSPHYAGVCPAPRCGHTAIAMFDDPLPKRTHLPTAARATRSAAAIPNEYAHEPMMVIFGGCDLRRQVSFGDVWAFFPRVRRWKCLFDCAAVPRGNLTFSLDLIPTDPNDFDTKEKMSFFPDDADFFQGADVKARLLALTGKVTGAKLHAAATARRPIRQARPPCQRWKAVAGALDELMFVFGGESSTFEVMDDLHTFNVLTEKWEVMRTRMSPWPSARFMHSACVVGTKMIISGGTGKRADVVMEDDTWILEMRTVLWRQVMGTSEVLNSSNSAADALERCPFLTRPRHVQQLPVIMSPTEKRLDLKASALLSSSNYNNKSINNNNNNNNNTSMLSTASSNANKKNTNSSSTAYGVVNVARCEVEGSILLPFDDRIIFYGGREVPTGRFVHNTYVLDMISERWFKAEDVMMDQKNLAIHGDITQLSPLPITEKTDAMLPAKRWAHCGAAVVSYSATRSMNLARSLAEIAYECGGNNICGTVRFTDQLAIDKYIRELQKDVVEQATFDGILATRGNKPIMSQCVRAFFFGGGATCSGSSGSRKAELSDCWQVKLNLKTTSM